jgi:methionyl-tRNA formyltransferase
VLHPEGRRKFGPQILATLGSEIPVIEGSTLREKDTLDRVKALHPELGVSIFFGYILRKEFLDSLSAGCVNLHPAYLPYNRGAYPNVWSIVDGSPAGVTLHYIDEGVDTGNIIAQREVPTDLTDTGKTLYDKLEEASLDLFKQEWPNLKSGRLAPSPQLRGKGTSHRVRDVATIDEILPDATYRAMDLINIIRARTFPPYRGAFIRQGSRKIYLRLELTEEPQEHN